jgi:tetratricopeptide (TPR) repeat protein
MVSREEYEKWLTRFFTFQNGAEESWGYQNLAGRVKFALILLMYAHEYEIGMKILQSVVHEIRHSMYKDTLDNAQVLTEALIHLGSWSWRWQTDSAATQRYFEEALEYIDRHPALEHFAGKIYYERCHVLLDLGRLAEALSMARELLESYASYGEQGGRKKIFYSHMFLAEYWHSKQDDLQAIRHLWHAKNHVHEDNPRVQHYLERQFKTRSSQPSRTYHNMFEMLEHHL